MIFSKKRKSRELSLTASNEKELISVVVSESSKKISVVRQSRGRISRDIYHLESIKAN